MEESNNSNEAIEESEKGLLNYDDDEKQTLFRIFGVEMTAPKGLKNPRIVYVSFIVINLILVVLLKSLL